MCPRILEFRLLDTEAQGTSPLDLLLGFHSAGHSLVQLLFSDIILLETDFVLTQFFEVI